MLHPAVFHALLLTCNLQSQDISFRITLGPMML